MHHVLCTKDDAEGDIDPYLRHIDRSASRDAPTVGTSAPFLSIHETQD